MDKKTNNSNLTRLPSIRGDNLLSKIFDIFVENLNQKIINCFDSIDKSLFQLAEKSDSNLKQTNYLDAMRLIRDHKNELINSFFIYIKSVFESYQKSDFNYFSSEFSYNQENESLELIKNSKLDESLAKTNLIKKSDAAYHRHIFGFKKRFSHSINKNELKAEEIPVGPFVIVQSFNKSIKKIEIDVDFKIIMYKFFERNVMGHLNNTYKKINDLFIKNGVIPEIKYNIYNENHQHNQITKPTQEINANPEKINANKASFQRQPQTYQKSTSNDFQQQNLDQNYHLITQFLALSRQISNQNQNQNQNEITPNNFQSNLIQISRIDVELVINALNILQKTFYQNNKKKYQYLPNEIKDELFEQLHKIDSKTSKQKIKQIDEDTIDLVGLLFQYIINDNNIPKTIQLILAKLQLPYLKIALQDRNLFGDKKHEARVLLDALAVASIGWTKESDLNNQFINKIEEITQHIIEIDEYNNKIFDMLLINFNAFISNLKKKSDVSIKRSKERADGDEKIILAKKKTAQLLVSHMIDKKAPLLIKDILLGEWASILILTHLKFSPDSKEFKKSVNFIAKILDCSLPKTNKLLKKTSINKILSIYENGLKFVIFKRQEIVRKKQKLQTCLYKIHNIFNKQTPLCDQSEITYTSNLLEFSSKDEIDEELMGYIRNQFQPLETTQENTINDKYIQKVSTLKLGTWLKIYHSDTGWIRAKLSWVSPVSGTYVFVNSRGYKIIEKSSKEIAEGFKDKTIQILLQIALFDRALASIAKDLNNNKKLFNTVD